MSIDSRCRLLLMSLVSLLMAAWVWEEEIMKQTNLLWLGGTNKTTAWLQATRNDVLATTEEGMAHGNTTLPTTQEVSAQVNNTLVNNTRGESTFPIEEDPAFASLVCDYWPSQQTNVTVSEDCCSPQHCSWVRQTTAYVPCCDDSPNPPNPIHKLLITSTPRSGTVFVSQLLSSLGLRLANDAQQPTGGGMVSWSHLYHDSYPDLLWTKKPLEGNVLFRHVVHQVRDPLSSITSIAFTEPVGHELYVKFISRHVTLQDNTTLFSVDGDEYDELRITRTLEFYIGWHQNIQKLGAPVFRLEDFVNPNQTIIADLFRMAHRVPPSPALIEQKLLHFRRRRLGKASSWHKDSKGQWQKGVINKRQKVDKNTRKHRPTLKWDELCAVNAPLTQRFLRLSQSLGYYDDMGSSVC